ncbi:hypothetical protein E1292_09000 [Nonomuraea deserti]|uniref:Uncharacterized protein n=1 Tax=Nonomuraea deserti TaxID=1848322 RepID=A0A4R4VYY9_9ACTN|nr:hypothetical protein [Nonomuraea deserti]TDD09637.1 hypothetical protein E1292_09000 [Nonomuraea deserti]
MLHYEFVPGLRQEEEETRGPFFWNWILSTEDDLNSLYNDHNLGAFASNGKAATHGTRHLGGPVPSSARLLCLNFTPAEGWTPLRSWCRQLHISVPEGHVTESWTTPRQDAE